MSGETRLYLDGCATTPPSPGVRRAVAAAQETCWGNPASPHQNGVAACRALEQARERVAELLDVPPDWVVFTSGGTEANHLALRGVLSGGASRTVFCSSVEHPAVLAPLKQLGGEHLQLLRPDRYGVVQPPGSRQDGDSSGDISAIATAQLVSVMGAQSEIGTLQPLGPWAAACRGWSVPFHTDAVQCCGKFPLRPRQLGVELLSLSAHKFRGPKGIGALVRNPRVALAAGLGGGGQEAGLRSGTVPVPLAVGFGVAAQEAQAAFGQPEPLWQRWTRQLREMVWGLPGIQPTGDPERRLPGHVSCLVATPAGEPLDGRRMVRALDRCGYAVSSGSACSSGSPQASSTLLAVGVAPEAARSGLRLCLGPWLCEGDTAAVEQQLLRFPQVLDRLRRRLAPGLLAPEPLAPGPLASGAPAGD